MSNVVPIERERALPADDPVAWVSPSTRLLHAVECVFSVNVKQLKGRNRTVRFTAARQAMAWCGRQLGVGYVQLGQAVDKHKTTVVKTLPRAETHRARDPYFARCCDEVLRRARDGML